MAAKRYALRVTGPWSDRSMRAFPGMQVTAVDPQTVIYGEVRDQEQLHNLLALCQALGLQVRSLTSSPVGPRAGNDPPPDEPAGGAHLASDQGGDQQPMLMGRDDCRAPVTDAQLGVDRPDVRLHGVGGDREVLGDLLE